MTKFEELYNQPNQSHEVLPTGRRKNRRTFYLKTMNCSVDQRSLPLGFSAGEIPSQDFLCDFKDCTQDDDTVVLLSCGHSFHDACLHENGCRYCQPYILDCIKRLAKAFNKSISAEADEEEEQPGGEQDNDEEEDAAEEQAEWYTTAEFRQNLSARLKDLPPSALRPEFVSARQKDRIREERRAQAASDHSYSFS